MPHYQLDNSVSTGWFMNNELWDNKEELSIGYKNHHYLLPQQQELPSSLVSNLSSLFLRTVNYYNLTKQEALDAIGYFLYEYDDLIHAQLLDCFIKHRLLLYSPSDHTTRLYLTINHHSANNISGIFTPLTKCYSPTCHFSHITCYSPLCPNKCISSLLRIVNQYNHQEQQTNEDNNGGDRDKLREQQRDWITCIPNHIRNSTNRKELKRQAGIAELITTERNYCQDLVVLHNVYAIPLLESIEVINNPSRRQRFHNNVFGNYMDITHLHHSFYNQLNNNRQSSFFIGRVGTIIMQHVTNLIEPYVHYASNHVKAIYCMTVENENNPLFANFLAAQNALKCTRRLGLRHYLSSPTLWIGKLKLMVEAILKNTVDDADQLSLKASLAILHDTLCRMNSCAKLPPEDLRFEELSTCIFTLTNGGTGGGAAELQLLLIPDNSVLIREEALWLARSTHPLQPSLCHVFLFSHALILTHPRVNNGRTEYIVINGSPIPIQFLSIGNSNASTSMIRRLSFASTSMVSTPIHLINNLRRQKSMNSETSTNSTVSNTSSTYSSTNSSSSNSCSSVSKLLCRSKTTIHVAASNNTKSTQIQSSTSSSSSAPDRRKNRILLPFQIKTKLSKLKNNLRTSFSLPVSPTTNTTTATTVSRRDSAPALLLSYHQQQQLLRKQDQQQYLDKQQQRRTLKICHMAYPDNPFKLEFLSRSDRLVWENVVRDVMINSDRQSQVFKSRMICKSLIMPPSTFYLSSLPTNASINVSGAGRIQCAYAFAHNGENMVAIGTQCGLWIGSRDTSPPSFQVVLKNQDVHQFSILQDKLIVLTHDNKQNNSSLIAYKLNSILNQEQQDLDWCAVKRSSVICFTVGKVRNQSIIAYLTKRLQTTWLVIVVPDSHNSERSNWFKKYKVEYKVTIKDPTDIQIINDSMLIRSDRNGVERIDISSSSTNNATNTNIFTGPNVGLLSNTTDKRHGLVCDSQYIYSVSLFDNTQRLIRTRFESQVNHIAIVYPYLVAFSSSVIEIRNIETTELVQAIRGPHIQFISITNVHTQPLLFTMMNEDNNKTASSSIYQLQLSL